MFFNIISVFWAIFSSFCQKTCGKIVKTEFHMSRGKLWRNLCFLKKNSGDLIVFRNEQKISAFCRNFSGRVVKTALDGSIGSIWAFCWIKKSDTFYHSRTLTISFRHSVEFFPASCKKKLSKSLISSWHTAEKFGPFVAKIPAGLPRLLSTCLQEQFETKSFLKKGLEFVLSFSDMSDKSLDSWQKNSLRPHRNT